MHEASLAQGLIDLATRAYENHNASEAGRQAGKIREIRCSYGLLSCFEAETLKACFEICAENTPCEGAALTLELEALPCECNTCKARFSLVKRKFQCPCCSGTDLSFSGGNGLVLQAIEVEEDQE